ncbi:DUF2778 domain-containing protein [Paraburkholderia sp. MMS20-SJTR3]|uniref:DUF2778 domain-containing protein n=1 Tax=Paraburkholderia sejongensis TaxID=2886946 RepID=A0ABS8K4K3_9BURK|nr:DUF2778 domain-containing protein [Paraburkholderia sp. MMS20-SJTR3]MCC8396900.1 DUF2778 domain-containing protein [Paraburkholderia sp. MMS20-SJTR3]
MPAGCLFLLNRKTTSVLTCRGLGGFEAFSGKATGRNNPDLTYRKNIGALPEGTYYLVDRQSGGRLGFVRDTWNAYGFGSTDHREWFMLWNPATGDKTNIYGIERGNFRLHPAGPQGLSEGCITVKRPYDFQRLAAYIRSHGMKVAVPGTSMKAYGTVIVRRVLDR